MGYDAAMVNTSVPVATSVKDAGKKKKNTRTAKLKQCKLDARREQWLSQVKNTGCKSGDHVVASPTNPASPIALPHGVTADGSRRDKLHIKPEQEVYDGTGMFQDSDLDSPVNSPTSCSSGINYIDDKSHTVKGCGSKCSGTGGSSSSSGTCSRSISEVDEEQHSGEDEGNLEDWEAVADALMVSDAGKKSESLSVPNKQPFSHQLHNDFDGHSILKNPEPVSPIPMAWRPDDAYRPRSLPSLSKLKSFPMDEGRNCGNVPWMNEALLDLDQPLSCPVCCEDLDNTDSRFIPCNCGFRLCLFCHKRILEADGRCPGCRKQYNCLTSGETAINGGLVFPKILSRTCSMSARY